MVVEVFGQAVDEDVAAYRRYDAGRLADKLMGTFGLGVSDADEAKIGDAVDDLQKRMTGLSDAFFWATGKRI